MSSIPIKSPREIEKNARGGAGSLARSWNRYPASSALVFSTREVDQYAADLIAAAGCKSAFLGYRKFPGNICISVNEEVVSWDRRRAPGAVRRHHQARHRSHQRTAGWATPLRRCRWESSRRRFSGSCKSPRKPSILCIPLVREGKRLHDVSGAIESYVTRNGYTVVREFVGHGVGRHLHEEPQVPNYRSGPNPKLKAGMTLAIEPMVNMGRAEVKVLGDDWTVVTTDGKPSAHFEHTVLVTKGEPEILTWREKTVAK